MAANANDMLIRKQYLVKASQVEKLEKLAEQNGSSVATVVRQAIDAYDPTGTQSLGSDELMDLVSTRLRDSIDATRKASRKVQKAIKALDKANPQ